MQVQLKGNKVITEIILNKRHGHLEVIQCEQYTQITDLVQKMYIFILCLKCLCYWVHLL